MVDPRNRAVLVPDRISRVRKGRVPPVVAVATMPAVAPVRSMKARSASSIFKAVSHPPMRVDRPYVAGPRYPRRVADVAAVVVAEARAPRRADLRRTAVSDLRVRASPPKRSLGT